MGRLVLFSISSPNMGKRPEVEAIAAVETPAKKAKKAKALVEEVADEPEVEVPKKEKKKKKVDVETEVAESTPAPETDAPKKEKKKKNADAGVAAVVEEAVAAGTEVDVAKKE